MQTLVFTLALMISVSFSAFSQTPYEKGMRKALTTWSEGQPTEASNIFERIAAVETDNWLPYYYVALINTVESFSVMEEVDRKAMLDKAMDYLNQAKAISKDNPEIMLVEAQWYTSWLAFDGEKYGMTYGPKVAGIYEKAAAIAPNNPRVAFGKVEWAMGTARYFGQPMEPYCEDLQKAILLYDNYEAESEFHPAHGKDYAEGVIKATCN